MLLDMISVVSDEILTFICEYKFIILSSMFSRVLVVMIYVERVIFNCLFFESMTLKIAST